MQYLSKTHQAKQSFKEKIVAFVLSQGKGYLYGNLFCILEELSSCVHIVNFKILFLSLLIFSYFLFYIFEIVFNYNSPPLPFLPSILSLCFSLLSKFMASFLS